MSERQIQIVKVDTPISVKSSFEMEKDQIQLIFDYLAKFSIFTEDVSQQLEKIPDMVDESLNNIDFDTHKCFEGQRNRIDRIETKTTDQETMINNLLSEIKQLKDQGTIFSDQQQQLRTDVDGLRKDVDKLQETSGELLKSMIDGLNSDIDILRNGFEQHRDDANLKLLQLEDNKVDKQEFKYIENQLNTRASDFELRMIKVEKALFDPNEPSRLQVIEQRLEKLDKEIKKAVDGEIKKLKNELNVKVKELIKEYLQANLNEIVVALIEQYMEKHVIAKFKQMIKQQIDAFSKKIDGKGSKAMEAWCCKNFADKVENEREHMEIRDMLKQLQIELRPPAIKVKFRTPKRPQIPFTRVGGNQTKFFKKRRGSFSAQLDYLNDQSMGNTYQSTSFAPNHTLNLTQSRPKSGLPAQTYNQSIV